MILCSNRKGWSNNCMIGPNALVILVFLSIGFGSSPTCNLLGVWLVTLLRCWCKHVHRAVFLPWRLVKGDGMLSLELLTKYSLDQTIWWDETIMIEMEKLVVWIVPRWIGPCPPSHILVHLNGSHLVPGLQRLKWIGWSPKQPPKVWSRFSAKIEGTCFCAPRLWLFQWSRREMTSRRKRETNYKLKRKMQHVQVASTKVMKINWPGRVPQLVSHPRTFLLGSTWTFT